MQRGSPEKKIPAQAVSEKKNPACWKYKVAYNPNSFFLNWKQRTAGKAVEDALQYIKVYVAGVWAKTAKGYFKNFEEQVIRRQSKAWSNL